MRTSTFYRCAFLIDRLTCEKRASMRERTSAASSASRAVSLVRSTSSALYGLRKLLAGPGEDGAWPAGVVFYHPNCGLEFFEQLTAEHVEEQTTRAGFTQKVWTLAKNRRNEELDIAVGCRALAYKMCEGMTARSWTDLAARRWGKSADAQGDLAALWSPTLAEARADEPGTSPPSPQSAVPVARPASKPLVVRSRHFNS